MGATNTTANYNLSQFISTDKPAWLQDYNGDMLKIDTAINAAKLAADTAQSTATNAQTDATSAVNSVTTLATTVSSLSTAIGNINGTLNTITSLIGNGTPTTTDHTIIGAINELHADQGDLADLQTTDKSSLVAAINEAAQSGGGGGGTSVEFDTIETTIDLSSHTGTNFYTASKSGYLTVAGVATCAMYSGDATSTSDNRVTFTGVVNGVLSAFIPKGMKIGNVNVSGGGTVEFAPIS